MRIAIDHTTEFRADAPAQRLVQQVRLTPAASQLQTVADWSVRLEGGALEAIFKDQHGNDVRLFCLDSPGATVRLRAHGSVETVDRSGVLGPHSGFAPLWLYLRNTDLTSPGERVRAAAADVGETGGDLDRLHRLNALVADRIAYKVGSTDVYTSAEEAFAAAAGVCQDHAHAFIAAARLLGFPARYVSGYMAGEDGRHQASHAWAEAHIDGLGWVGFDPANRQSPDERYVRLATGLDYSEAAPMRGVVLGGAYSPPIVTVQIQQ